MLKMAYMNFYFRFHPKCRPLGISHCFCRWHHLAFSRR
jgi:hypothetical protein